MEIHIVTTPKEIHPDVLAWLTAGWNGDSSRILPFLRHLAALKKAASTNTSSFIIVEEGCTLHPNFNQLVAEIIPKIPIKYNTCLLSHYVSSWDGITFIEGTANKLVTVTGNVHSSFAYWMTGRHLEHLLGIYDQPLRNLPQITPDLERITRSGHVCMVHVPIVANLKEKNYVSYFSNYDFKVDE